jgi:hypothetical protein
VPGTACHNMCCLQQLLHQSTTYSELLQLQTLLLNSKACSTPGTPQAPASALTLARHVCISRPVASLPAYSILRGPRCHLHWHPTSALRHSRLNTPCDPSLFRMQDVLGQPATRLLVSHCGLHSIYEATFHGVPVVGLPFMFEQVGGLRFRVGGFGV